MKHVSRSHISGKAPPSRGFRRFFYLPKLRNGNTIFYLERRFDAKRVRLTKEEELLQRFREMLYPIEYSDFTYPDDTDMTTRRRVIKSPSLLLGIPRFSLWESTLDTLKVEALTRSAQALSEQLITVSSVSRSSTTYQGGLSLRGHSSTEITPVQIHMLDVEFLLLPVIRLGDVAFSLYVFSLTVFPPETCRRTS